MFEDQDEVATYCYDAVSDFYKFILCVVSPLMTKVLGFERIYARISVWPHGHGDCIGIE